MPTDENADRRYAALKVIPPREEQEPRMTLPPPDRFGHVDAWANGERYRWAAELLVEGASRRCERINAAIEILKACAERHPAVRAALQIRTDGPGPGPRSIRLDPEQRQLLRAALVALSTR